MTSQTPTADETRHQLEELGKRIQAARSSLGARQEIAVDADKAWNDMVKTHAEIRRMLEQSKSPSASFLEGLRFDIDILNHSFERWMARVEGGFGDDNRGK